MKMMIGCDGNSFIGDLVAYDLEYAGQDFDVDLEHIRCACVDLRFPFDWKTSRSYIEFEDGTRLDLIKHVGERATLRLKGTITLRVCSLSNDITFDVQEIDELRIPATGKVE